MRCSLLNSGVGDAGYRLVAGPAGPLILLVCLGIAGCKPRTEGARPNTLEGYNVLFITLDTTRSDRIGCYGYSLAQTPVLDELGATGVRFARAYSHVPLTAPSHASIMAGVYPPEHGVRMNGIHRLGDDFETLAERFADSGYRCGAFVSAFVLNSRFGLNQGFKVYGDDLDLNEKAFFDPLHQERKGDRVCDEALQWLENVGDDRFFCWVHFFDPHHPYEAPEPYRTQNSNPYDAEVAFMDAQVGRLVGFLNRSGKRSKTLIVAVGDHGEGLGDHDEDTHATFIYQTVMHVPMIFNLPERIGKGVVAEEVVRIVDVYPTLMDLMGWDTPGRVSGESMIGAFRGEALSDRSSYCESEYAYYDFGWSPLRGLITDQWKYIRAPERELFDLHADPHELENVGASSAAKLQEMESHLATVESDMITGQAAEVQLDPDETQALLALGYAGAQEPVKPAGDISKLKDPKNMRTVHQSFSMANEALIQGRLEEARKLLEPIVRLSPESPKIHSKLGKVYLVTGDLEKARATLEQAVQLQPSDAKSRNHLGSAYAALREPAKAEEQFIESLKLNPNQPPVLDELTTVLLQLNRYDDAIKHIQMGIDVDPKESQNYVSMSRVYQAQNRQKKSIEVLEQAVKRADYPTRVHEELAMISKRSGDQEEAKHHFESAAKLYREMLEQLPGQPDLLTDLANVLIELQDYDKATEALEAAMKTAPSRALPHIGMGRIHHRQGRLEEGERSFNRALELEPRNARAYERLGALMGQQEKWPEAERHFRKALEIDPNFLQAQENLKRLEDYLASVQNEAASQPASQPATAPSSTSN